MHLRLLADRFRIFLFCAISTVAGPAASQDAAWVQIEARPSLAQAQERAVFYQARLDDVQGFRLPSGWYAIALGPYTPDGARATLLRLRSSGLVPSDSFVADGSGFGAQFWPEDSAGNLFAPREVIPLPDETPPTVLEAPSSETLAEARAAERALSRPEREEIQRALQWEGFYTARIDGAFGPGTRRAIEGWQAANAFPLTGVLLTVQREQLIDDYRAMLEALGLRQVVDEAAGIEIVLPAAMVARSREEAPFVEYGPVDGSGVRVLLISQSGGPATLAALYEVIQTLEIVPLEGARSLGAREFTITGEGAEFVSYTFAETRADAVKGFTLVWPVGDEKRRLKALREMQASFSPVAGRVLPGDSTALDGATRRELLAGLSVRQPVGSVSGVYVDGAGRVLTATAPLDTCTRVTTGEGTEMALAAEDRDSGLALFRPVSAIAPISVAAFDPEDARIGAEVAVAGYSFGGVLGAPTMTFGRVEDTASLDGGDDVLRLALLAEDGDIGGPVIDARGAVQGVLLPKPDKGGRQLPENVRYAADAAAIRAFLSEQGVRTVAGTDGEALDPVALSARAADMTVLLRCWN